METKETTYWPMAAIQPKYAMAIAVLSVGAVAAIGHAQFGLFDYLTQVSDPEVLAAFIGRVGPISVVILLALAVVVSPIPSGPIAMAAGAILGPMMGGAMTAAGAVLGAVIAFLLSRAFGYQPLSASKAPMADWITRPRKELSLAAVVLISRLIPFISFDAVSYVAGLTSMRVRAFVIATTLGVLPASFAFAALGAGMATMDNTLLMIAACGVTAVLPIGWAVYKGFQRRRA